MTEDVPTNDPLKGTAALAAVPPADGRSHQPDFVRFRSGYPDDEVDPNDTTTILHGAKAATGKAVWSAMLQGVNGSAAIAQYEEARKKQEEREAAEARELAMLAEWNTRRTSVGGVEMTNAEAQDARQHVIDNDEKYADWAVQHGYITADEKDDFKQGIRRKKELEDRRGRGILTPAEEREAARLDASRVGHAVDAATAQGYRDQGMGLSATMRRDTGNEALRRPDAKTAVDPAVFQSYDAACAAPLKVPPAAVAPKVKATGLDL